MTEPEKRTLKDLILHGRDKDDRNVGVALHGTICVDIGAHVTIMTLREGIIEEGKSSRKGQSYVIHDLMEWAPGNIDERRATLEIRYLKTPTEPMYTYLDQRLNDEVKF